MVQTILFATNRLQDGMKDGLPNFASVCVAPDQPIACAAAAVDDVVTTDQNSGDIKAVTAIKYGSFADADLAPILASTKDVLVFIHGAENDFHDAITRAAYNQAWLSEQKPAGGSSDFDIVAFTWPGMDYPIEQVQDLPGALIGYKHDRSMAGHSGGHIAAFLRLMAALRGRIGTRKMHLICHSMGVYALGGGVETFFRQPGAPAAPIFDQILLAAGDEDPGTFTKPDGERLSNLHLLGHQITVYFNHNDIGMHASRIANSLGIIFGIFHLGYDGPIDMDKLKLFPKTDYSFVNCVTLTDYNQPTQGDHTHQYYRESPTVRADIASVLTGKATRPFYYKDKNFFAFAKVDFSGVE